eukprot:TRINITY_DN644_c0_g3_i2.p2 TRINITY_DN644_c0_g3~~TRINITY_DN644_c0_g3_i2.p2  ORF type:complete len:225 (-),score=49.92 TRINITY_DN644_c0_g3_i2:901-1575(-)
MLVRKSMSGEDKATGYIDHSFKVILTGEKGSGKTCLAHRIVSGTYSDHFKPTMYCSYSNLFYKLCSGHSTKSVRIALWDTSGEEKFHSLTKTYFAGASGAIVLYDVTSVESLVKVGSWMSLIMDHADPDVVLYLVGAKADLITEEVINTDMVDEYIKKQGLDFKGCTIISSKTGAGVEKLFEDLGKTLIEKKSQESTIPFIRQPRETQRLSTKIAQSPKHNCQC